MRTSVYIDGLNLYHGCVKDTQFKWLDLVKFCQHIVGRRYRIDTVKYFTAKVQDRSHDPQASQRQMTYINALEHTYPDIISVFYGYFSSNVKRMRVANPPPNTVEVIKTEEKGTDVNLSTHFLNDAWLNDYECGVILSNDADMVEAMRLVQHHHPRKDIGLINPFLQGSTLQSLKDQADFVRKVRRGNLAGAQLPERIPGSNYQKPEAW